ncbi:hypothetical protein ACSYDW_07065 [Paeniglutamicibacter sp. R2-26]|uniref:hypothetical protein n=1 Tax=Paeniglutamicibacter sp. R2-26 TaxID=3144417 RepID=UPI003EE44092
MSETIGYIEHGDTAEAAEAETRAFRAQETRPRAAAKAAKPSLLDELREDSADEISKVEAFEVTGRKGMWSAEFNCIISEPEIKRYDDKAMGNKKDPKKKSQRTLAAYVLSEKCVGLYKGTGPDRVLVEDSDGDPLTFQSDEFREAQGHPNDGFAAILHFLGDAQAITMSSAVLREGGWSADLTPLDPTNG